MLAERRSNYVIHLIICAVLGEDTHRFWVVGNPETGDKTSFEDISPLKSAWHHPSGCTEYTRIRGPWAFIDPDPATSPRSQLMAPVVVRSSTSE
jgi:hypothetical protein